MLDIPKFNQWDHEWTTRKIGNTNLTLGRWGCAITAIAAGLKLFGITETPETANRKLKAVDGFTSDGSLYWKAINRAWPTAHWHVRNTTTNDKNPRHQKQTIGAAMTKIYRALDAGQIVLLNVDNVNNDGRSDHWVIATGRNAKEQLGIMNPDGGQHELFSKRYGDPLKGIYGYAIIIGPAQSTEKQAPLASTMGKALAKTKEIERAARIFDYDRVRVFSRELTDTLL